MHREFVIAIVSVLWCRCLSAPDGFLYLSGSFVWIFINDLWATPRVQWHHPSLVLKKSMWYVQAKAFTGKKRNFRSWIWKMKTIDWKRTILRMFSHLSVNSWPDIAHNHMNTQFVCLVALLNKDSPQICFSKIFLLLLTLWECQSLNHANLISNKYCECSCRRDVAVALINSAKWREVLQNETRSSKGYRETPMRKLIRKMPGELPLGAGKLGRWESSNYLAVNVNIAVYYWIY